MALTKPILLSQVAFDATQQQIIKFNVIGGSQVVANTLKISNNTTGTVVYTNTQSSFKFEHIIAPNSLINGTYYVAQVQTQDAQGNLSEWSNSVTFYCYSQPVLAFTNIPSTGIIENSNYTFDVTYTQEQGELLSLYDFILYDTSGIEIATSGVHYVGGIVPPPTVISYSFSGFENNVPYRIECLGVTVNGTEITTGKVEFTTSYRKPYSYGILNLENNCDDGYINISCNMLEITAHSQPDPPIYIDNKEVNLTESNTYVEWVDGFNILTDFTARIWGRAFKLNGVIATFADSSDVTASQNKMVITYSFNETNKQVFISLGYYNNGVLTTITSNPIPIPLARDQVFIWIRKVGENITVTLASTYIDPDRTYTWYDVNNRFYTFEEVNALGLNWTQVNQGGW